MELLSQKMKASSLPLLLSLVCLASKMLAPKAERILSTCPQNIMFGSSGQEVIMGASKPSVEGSAMTGLIISFAESISLFLKPNSAGFAE